MEYVRILQYEDARKRAENNIAEVLDPKIVQSTAYIIKDNGFIRQNIIGGSDEKMHAKIFAFDF
jgi:hypothetical protein